MNTRSCRAASGYFALPANHQSPVPEVRQSHCSPAATTVRQHGRSPWHRLRLHYQIRSPELKSRVNMKKKVTTRPATKGKSISDSEELSLDKVGNGGELHQNAGGKHPPLTTQTGAIVADDEN